MDTKLYSETDKGYAFVILLASFFAHVLQYGVVWTVGVFFAIFVEVFPDNSGVVALISSLNTAFYYGAGPLAGFLTNKYGPRKVSMIGGFLGSAGLILSMYANNVYTLYITFGIIAGFGLGLAYIPSVTILGSYFDRYRSIAIGVAVSGCGVGTFIFPPLIRLCISQFGWRGALLLIGGITLNMCVCGALLRPFREAPRDLKSQYEKLRTSETEVAEHPQQQKPQPEHVYTSIRPNFSKNPTFNITNASVLNLIESKTNLSSSITIRATNDPEAKMPLVAKHKTITALISNEHSYHRSMPCVMGSRSTLPGSLAHPATRIQQSDAVRSQMISSLNINNNSCYTSLLTVLGSRADLPHTIENVEFKPRKRNLINIFIFRNMTYVLLCINNFALCFGLSIVYVHLAAYAASTGIDSQRSAMLFSVIGISNFVGRFTFGALGHTQCIGHTCLYAIALFCAGFMTFVAPFYDSYYWLIVIAGGFGFLTGSFGSLLPQVIIQILEIQYLTSGYGYLLIFEAMGTLLGAPSAGWLYVWTEDYGNSLYLGGAVIMLASLSMFYPWLCSRRCRKNPNVVEENVDVQNRTDDVGPGIEVITVNISAS